MPKVKIALPSGRELNFYASGHSPHATFCKPVPGTAAGTTFCALMMNLGTFGDAVWASPDQLFWTHLIDAFWAALWTPFRSQNGSLKGSA